MDARYIWQLRRATLDDAHGLWATEHAIIDAGDGVVQETEDLPPSVPSFRRVLEKRLRDPFEHLLVGVQEGRVCGYAEWSRYRPGKLRHVVRVAVGVTPEFQRQGLGRALMTRLIDDAKRAEPKIRRLELTVIADNQRARALYETLGFRLEGVRRAFVRDGRGERDDCLMGRLL